MDWGTALLHVDTAFTLYKRDTVEITQITYKAEALFRSSLMLLYLIEVYIY